MERVITEDKWQRVQGMGCVRSVGNRINHLLRIAVICSDDSPAAEVLHRLDQASHTGIKRLNSPYGGGEIPRMPHHISVGEIEDDSLHLPCTQTRYSRLSNLVSTHLRLQIVGRYFWRRDQQTVFSSKWRFHTSVKEIRHMGIFFRFSHTQIVDAMLSEDLS